MKARTDGLGPYEALRNAIVVQAAEDYRASVRKIRRAKEKLKPLEEKLSHLMLIEAENDSAEARDLKWQINNTEIRINTQTKAINSAAREIVQIEKFFLSEWYESICSVSGELILKELRKEAEDDR